MILVIKQSRNWYINDDFIKIRFNGQGIYL
jgi:hypothetical protein